VSVKRDNKGFTLLEVLVALTVLSISLAALLPVFSTVAKSEGRLADERFAITLARSKLDTLGVEAILTDGVTDGKFSNGMSWRLEVAPYQMSTAPTPLSMKRATLTVHWPKADGSHTATISTVRLAPQL